jgi:uncharacterized membrane protein YqhA
VIRTLLWRYRWLLVAVVCVYVAVSLLLLYLTSSPQAVPFQYQVR